jgi:hypothetical protein
MSVSIDSIHDSVLGEIDALRNFGVLLFWLRVEDDRDKCKAAIAKIFEAEANVFPVVLRKSLFLDPNAWAMDVAAVLADHREYVIRATELIESGRPLAVVVIAKTALDTAQSSSPARLPDWFPRFGGQEVAAIVRDLTVVAGATLKDKEARLGDLSCSLFGVEQAACSRFEQLLSLDKHHGQPLWNSLVKARSGAESRQLFLVGWKEGLRRVGDPYGYRPTLKEKYSLVGALWSAFIDTPPAGLGAVGDALQEFLGLKTAERTRDLEPLLPILFRGVNDGSLGRDVKVARGIIIGVGSACQLVTAGAHADQYGRVRASLLSAISIDMREWLGRVELILKGEVEGAK